VTLVDMFERRSQTTASGIVASDVLECQNSAGSIVFVPPRSFDWRRETFPQTYLNPSVTDILTASTRIRKFNA
jgi:hypothetical protein